MSTSPNACPRCSQQFDCGAGSGACWCADVDINKITRTSLAQFYDGCLCRECLEEINAARPQTPTVRAFLASQLRRKSRREQ
ncbi:MAG: cysteine-rich CWC family protein [Actinobacteria bacterium]|nr:cysteine-rich CWC family protein [Actinomycetota bacterium]